MKLFTKYNRTNIITTIVIFIIGSIAFFFVLRYVLIEQLNDDLQSEQQEIIEYKTKFNHFAPIIPTKDQITNIDSIDVRLHNDTYYSLVKWNPIKNGNEWFREINFTTTLKNKLYEITVSDSEEETYDLLKLIIAITIAMIALILIVGFFINRIMLKRLWKPFYNTIEKINAYNLISQQVLQLEDTPIDEFNILNKNITSMVERVQYEYRNLKEFTGNAAHEMQTPLAVIRAKLDLLVQDEANLLNNANPITGIEIAVNKLSRLFNSLLLLTKIENRQFELNEKVQLDEIIENKLTESKHLIDSKGIILTKKIMPTNIVFHQQLADILIGNLLNNATRYNCDLGRISIILTKHEFTISNTSPLPPLDGTMVFQRFYRHTSTKQEGNGLGLSIVKQICDTAGYELSYKFYSDQHIISILFNNY
ncbi:MAG TPA: HAMP domain-containing sensor histidine kinase [Ferruginibacter sp.]|jgi:two-component system sensor histidine kinase QseC|nr:HAMP domain-containing sensor histidine kinase [Ferruginibacter sp.]